jgi:hypothetical protein
MSYDPSHRKPPRQERWPQATPPTGWPSYRDDDAYLDGEHTDSAYPATVGHRRQAGYQGASDGPGDRGYRSAVATDTSPPAMNGYGSAAGFGPVGGYGDARDGYDRTGNGYGGSGNGNGSGGYGGSGSGNGYGTGGYPNGGYAGGINGYAGAADDFAEAGDGYGGTRSGYAGTVSGYPSAADGYADAGDSFAGAADRYGRAADGYGQATDEYAGDANGYAWAENGYGSATDGYAGATDGYAGATDEYAEAPDGYGTAVGGYAGAAGGYGGAPDAHAGAPGGYAGTPGGYAGGRDDFAGAAGYIGPDGYAEPGFSDPMLVAPDAGVDPGRWRADQDLRREAGRRGLAVGAVTGVLAAAVAIGVSTLAAGFVRPQASPMAALGSVFIDRTPTALKNAALHHFGTHGRTALLLGMYAAIAVLALGIGVLARHAAAPGVAAFAAFSMLAAFVTITRPGGHVGDVAPAIIGGIAGVAALLWLRQASAPPQRAPGLRPTRGNSRRRA